MPRDTKTRSRRACFWRRTDKPSSVLVALRHQVMTISLGRVLPPGSSERPFLLRGFALAPERVYHNACYHAPREVAEAF